MVGDLGAGERARRNAEGGKGGEPRNLTTGYKALAKSTTGDFIAYIYAAFTLELAKERAVAICQQRHPGHTCKIIDPPESHGNK